MSWWQRVRQWWRHPRVAVRRCPFHEEATPSLIVDVVLNKAHCLGCGWSGKATDLP